MVEGLLPWCGELGTFLKDTSNSIAVQNNIVKMSLGDLSGGGTPGNIPNPEVKPVSADGTWRETSRESRSLPRGFSFYVQRCGLFTSARESQITFAWFKLSG